MRNNNRYKRLIGGKGNYMSTVYCLTDDLRTKYSATESFYDQVNLLGQIDGIEYGSEASHKKVIETLIETKNEIKELGYDQELFHLEINYLKGYIKGLETILKENRNHFAIKFPIMVLGFFEDENIMAIFKMAFLTGGFQEFTMEEIQSNVPLVNCFYFTTSREKLISALRLVNRKDFDITINFVFRDKKGSKNVIELVKILTDIEIFRFNCFIYKEECNVEAIIKKMIKNVVLDK
ncbi:hypothetical protein [Thermincola ferriacetica]